MVRLVIGTRNPGKFVEIKTILSGVAFELVSLAEFDQVVPPKEVGATYEENAIIKAKSYAAQTGLVTLADDSGLEVESLDWAPGVLSARYAGEGASDAGRRQLLLAEIDKTGSRVRTARFVCAVAIARPDQTIINLAEAICSGRIVEAERGNGGFGYDPLFVPDGYELTFSELDESLKNEISHRGLALAQTREFLLKGTALDEISR